jgi:hypothetical protein
MGNLLDAILKHETNEIRVLVRNNPSLASERSPAGNLPLDVAKSTGNVISYVALLRENCPSESGDSIDCAKLLEEYIHTLSDDYACASWLSGIEYMVYAAMTGDESPVDDRWNLSKLDSETIGDLQYLLDESGEWPHWNDNTNTVELLSIEAWENKYHNL